MYRAITYAAMNKNIDINDEHEINRVLSRIKLRFKKSKDNKIDVHFNSRKVNNELRTHQVDLNVSRISSYQKVREYLVKRQKEISKNYNVILEGRDIGTVVFPHTPYKFYLDASIEERAKRRMLDVKNKEKLSFEKIKKDIIKRDKFDSTRKLSPLKKAKDSVNIDSTNMSIDDVANTILEKIKSIKFC